MAMRDLMRSSRVPVPRRTTHWSTGLGRIQRRHFHATKQQPMWFVAVGLGCAGLFVGTRYILRTQERLRRRRDGLPEEDEEMTGDDAFHGNDRSSTARHRAAHILGVDFGTANMRLASASLHHREQAPRVIENEEGRRAIPAVVAVDNGVELVGTLAQSLLGRKQGHAATATRLLLGRPAEELATDAFVKTLPFTVHTTDNRVEIELDGQQYSTEWAAEVLLDRVHAMATSSLGEAATHDGVPAIVTVPAGASERQRVAIERSAVAAGFDLMGSIDEPVAALYAVERAIAIANANTTTNNNADPSLDRQEEAYGEMPTGPIAVFDMGGYVSTFSVLARSPRDTDPSYTVRECLSSTGVSGVRVDDLLFRRVVDAFQRESGIDLSIDPMASVRIRDAVETAKMELSWRRRTEVNLPFITANAMGAKHLVQTLTAMDLQRTLETPMTEALSLCQQVLQRAEVSKDEIALLVVIGGGVRSEYVRTEMERFFKRSAFRSKDFAPDEAVVTGATEYARRMVVQ